MAKRSTTTSSASGENIQAALDRISTHATTHANQLDKDHGIVASAIEHLRSQVESLTDELDDIKAKHEKEMITLVAEHKAAYSKLETSNKAMASRLAAVTGVISQPLSDGSRFDGK